MKEDSLMKFSMNASAFISQISVRVDGNSLNEIKLSGKKVLIYSGLFQEQGELLVQHLKKPQQIVGVYGVKDKCKHISSLGFIVTDIVDTE